MAAATVAMPAAAPAAEASAEAAKAMQPAAAALATAAATADALRAAGKENAEPGPQSRHGEGSRRGRGRADDSDSDGSEDGGPAERRGARGGAREPRPWGAAALPLNGMRAMGRGAVAPPPVQQQNPYGMHPGYYQPAPAPVQFSPYPLGGARPVPIGIGVPGPGGTIPAHITSPEHLHAYADYCKRTLHNAVNGNLMSKRDRLVHQLARLAARAEEVRSVSAAVDRETRAEAEEGLETIKSSEARALLLLQQQTDDLSRHLHAIQARKAMALERVAEEVSAATSAAESPLRFLERFRALADACDRLSAKPFREDIALSAEEFEREIRLAVARPDTEREVLQKLLAVKDQMIWSLVEERDGLRAAHAHTVAELEELKVAYDNLKEMTSRSGSAAGERPR